MLLSLTHLLLLYWIKTSQTYTYLVGLVYWFYPTRCPSAHIHIFYLVPPSTLLILCWRHQMDTFSALLTLCAGSSPVTGEFHIQRPVTRSFDVFSDLRLNQKLRKQWRRNRAHYDITVIIPVIGITIQQLCNKVSSSLYFFVIYIHDFSLCYLF